MVLGLGDWHVTAEPDLLMVCLGLGSCVAVCLHDPVGRVGGMAHMVLPDSHAGRPSESQAKFVDLAVPLLLRELSAAGAVASRLTADIVGGATMLAVATGRSGPDQVGPRNARAARAALERHGQRVRIDETGGSHGRTVRLHVASGEIEVLTGGRPRNAS